MRNAIVLAVASIAAVMPATADSDFTTGSFDRVIAAAGKRVVPCPKQDESTAVLLVFGQSNSANHAERSHQSRHPGKVVNFFDGKCYEAGSPLLGADGTMGESFTLLGDLLVQAGIYKKVVLVSTGIGGTEIGRWKQGGDLNAMLLGVVDGVRPHYRFTHLLWHQGESDAEHTSAEEYTRSFRSMPRACAHTA